MVDLSLIFRIINIVVGCLMIIGGAGTIVVGGFPNFIQGIYCILLGIMAGVFEFQVPGQVAQFASFMFSFLGRGIFYIFIGCITMNWNLLSLICGIIIAVIGVAYVVLHFVPAVEPPSNMRYETYEQSMGRSVTHAVDPASEQSQKTQLPEAAVV
ncbi:Golgi apparatus membrane protein TVP15 [Radiomyces spectabilis]|uniref:Golgi apparatus membrane protein TVP15 n=1 Tax=Radiomyces spectabilis TaxID=64574 RepID=UPI00221EDF85|nr:Golgi apparatus membrane protein TVP15 [Radiomyces spectabilis]KAI8393968.1 Golgi apparatus membrane protein TVP15 [Radiomyces spectabilis]